MHYTQQEFLHWTSHLKEVSAFSKSIKSLLVIIFMLAKTHKEFWKRKLIQKIN